MSLDARESFLSDQKFLWFYRSLPKLGTCTMIPGNSFYDDKIGISIDTLSMMHDNVLYLLSKLDTLERVETIDFGDSKIPKKIKVSYHFYRVGSRGDMLNGAPVTLLYFKFFYDGNKYVFAFIGYLDAQFRRIV